MTDFNSSFFEIVFGFAHRSAFLDGAIVFLASYLPYLMLVAWLWYAVANLRGWRTRLVAVIEGVLGVIVSRGFFTSGIRFFYPYPRPSQVFGVDALLEQMSHAFPSGHASVFFALAMSLLYMNRRAGIWFFVAAIINGFARVAAGVHWPLDIVGGAGVGILGAILVHTLLARYSTELHIKKKIAG